MKAKLLHLFAVCMAMVTAIPIALANPANYKITFNSTAVATHQVSLYTSTGSAQQMSVANDVMYTIMPANSGKQVSYYDCSTKTLGAINTGSTNLISCGSATDDSGNLIVGVEQSFFYSTVNTIKVFKANKSGVVSTSSTKTYNLGRSGTNAFRTDMWHASGDIYGGNGSLWFSNGTYIVEVPIKNGTVQSIITHTTPSTPAGLSANGWASQTRLAPYGNSNEFVYNNGQGVYDITINNSTITGTKLTDYSRHGGDIEYLRGHKIFARNANAAANDGYITIEDITTGTAQTIQSAFLVAQGVGGFTGQTNVWCEFKLIDDNTLALYTFVPKGGFSKYLITATPDVSNITSLSYKLEESNGIQNIKLSWTAPSKGVLSEYYIYRGNSLIGKTTTTSYTDQNVFENATYKVVPVFDGVPEDSKYGATVTTTDVVTCTDPVTNVTVAYNNNVGNSIVVSWDAPNGVIAPNKYQVCYSTNGGTSWSTPVETTDLTYTFDNLAVGTYTFKVTPIYNGSAGEEAASGNINALAPTGHELIVTRKWTEGIAGTVDGAKNMAVSNDRVYLASPNYAALPYVGPNVKDKIDPTTGNWPNLSTDYAVGNVGFSMDNDDAGNIIVKTGDYFGNAATQFSIFPAGATTKDGEKKISVTGDYAPGGRADYIGAQGDLYNGTGYIWLIPQNAQKVVRITVVKGATSAITTWPLESNIASAEVIVRPLDGNRLYYHHQGTGYRIITLPEPNTTITSNLIENISVTGTPYSNLSSDMFTLQGNLLQVRSAGEGSQDISFCIANLSNNGELLKYNDKTSITPFDGTTSSLSRVGSLVRAVKVDDYNYDVYSYSPGFGADCYRVTANPVFTITGAIQSLDYEYSSTETEEGIRQDVVLTWTAPENAFPTSYKIYRNGSFLKSVDGSTLTYTDKNINENYTYKVVPYFAGIAEDASLGLEVTTTEVETILYAPTISDVRNYDGYSIVEIFYKMPSLNKVKPAYYNIYRNGVLLETGMTQYNFIDDQLPKISDDVEYTYTVEAVYSATYDNATRTSQGEDIMVKARDWGLSGYQLQEIYNIPVSPAIGNLPNNFTNFEYYRQGHFYNGSWYIAQRADNLAKKDDPNVPTSDSDKYNDIKSDVAGTTGGVLQIKANTDIDIYTGFTANKPITSEAFASVGLAIDDAGNIFMRHNNSNAGLAATAPTIDRITGLPINWLTYISDGFTRRITRGAIYKHKGDGTYETEPTIINLDPLWTSNDWINTMAFTYQNGSAGDKNGQVTGRSDYYSMYGDVMSAEGGFILISPSWTHCIFKVKVANGEYVNHETHDIKEYQSAEGQVNVKTGTENYGFRIDGRNAWVAQIRSNGYFGIHGEEDHAGEGEEVHEHEKHAIFVADSRINNTGGTSIVAFDNKSTEVNDGETFLITPASMYSRNYGDFIVTRGTKSSVGDAAADAKFMPPMPVAQMKQTDINDNIATNANGNWFHAEISTYTNTEGKDAECVDIYQYVPGVRFAKYRLIPDLSLPVVSPTLEITTAYSEGRTAITHFNGRSTWQRPGTFALTDPDNASVWIKSYSFELLDAKGNVVYSDEVPEAKDADGNIVIDYEFDYVVDKGIDNVDNCDLDFQTYTARIAVNYEFKNGDIQQSSFNYAIASNDYDAEKASDLAVHVFKKEKVTEYVWVENPNTTETTEDDWVAVPKEFDTYRVELDFNPPAWSADANPEPISYYTVKALVNNQTDLIEITDFHLHTGAEVVNGVEKATYEVASQIPGTYNFSQYNNGGNKAPYYHTVGKDYGVGGESRRAGVLTWHHKVDYGQYTGGVATTAEGDEIVITDEPNKWVFIVEAHYGAKNRYIAKSAEASIGV
ncbi:MAG: fibronectin type III domain-containing protein, partial [Muribaculaceae bacterium]|nr:fibronectin type III domain-containing protein [Muribaculaceae bacterium]